MRILIADKNRSFRADFVELMTLCQPTWQVRETADLLELEERLRTSHFDVVFLDLMLPGLPQAKRKALRASYPKLSMIGIGDSNDNVSLIACLQEGLQGYFARQSSLRIQSATLKRIGAGGNLISTIPLHVHEEAPHDLAPSAADGECQVHLLTARQSDVLSLLAEGRSTKDIARRLGLAVPTVKTHLAAVYRQLGARNRLEAVVKAGARAGSAPARAMVRARPFARDLFERQYPAN